MAKVKSYSVETIMPGRMPAIWVMMEPNIYAPICYLKRPKWLSDAQWEAVLGAIQVNATANLLEVQ
jgi:hypothetical protein